MQPYIKCIIALVREKGIAEAIEEIAALPLEKRYVWRIASALKWAFDDFDSVSVRVDFQTLPLEDRRRCAELIRPRPLQFCLFLSAFLGQEQMELEMLSALDYVREMASATSEGHE